MHILVNPSLTSFSLMANMSGFNRHFLLISVCFIHIGEGENEEKMRLKVYER